MQGKYYLYINQDDLNRFLLENLIFPHNNSFIGRKTLALSFTDCLFLTNKKLKEDYIIK